MALHPHQASVGSLVSAARKLVEFVAAVDGTIAETLIVNDTPNAAGTARFDVRVDGVSIYATDGDKPLLLADATEVSQTELTGEVSQGQKISVWIETVPAGGIGAKLTCQVGVEDGVQGVRQLFQTKFLEDDQNFTGYYLDDEYEPVTGLEVSLLNGHSYFITGIIMSPPFAEISGWTEVAFRLKGGAVWEGTLTSQIATKYGLDREEVAAFQDAFGGPFDISSAWMGTTNGGIYIGPSGYEYFPVNHFSGIIHCTGSGTLRVEAASAIDGSTSTIARNTCLIVRDISESVGGNTVHHVIGLPPVSLGVDGDFVIRTDTNHIYGPKSLGSWGVAVAMTGPQGPMGPEGPAGEDGAGAEIPEGDLNGDDNILEAMQGRTLDLSAIPSVFEDDFEGSAINTAIWSERTAPMAGHTFAAVALNKATFTVDGTLGGTGGWKTIPVNMTNKFIKMKTTFPNGLTGVDFLNLRMVTPSGNKELKLYWASGNAAHQGSFGTVTGLALSDFAYIRFRHVSGSSLMFCDRSSDGSTWNIIGSAACADASSCYFEFTLPDASIPLALEQFTSDILPADAMVDKSLLGWNATDGEIQDFTPAEVKAALFVEDSIIGTTASIADNASATITPALGKSYLLTKVSADKACRIRIYRTAAALTADAARAIGVDPTGEHELLLDLVLDVFNLSYNLAPLVCGATGEVVRSGNASVNVTNMSGSTGTVAVTFTKLTLEA